MVRTVITEQSNQTMTIHCGLKNMATHQEATMEDVYSIISMYVNSVKWCVSVTPTKYIYVDGCENGFTVGIINYPRFPTSFEELKSKTLGLAELLLEELKQQRLTITLPTCSIMLVNDIDFDC